MQVLDHLLAAIFGQRRNGYADQLAIVHRIEPEVGAADGLLDGGDLADVPGRDGDELRLRRTHVGQLVQRHL